MTATDHPTPVPGSDPSRPGESGGATGATPPVEPLAGSGVTVGAAAGATVVRRRRLDARRRRLTWGLAAATVLFVAGILALLFVGYRTALLIGGGSSDRITDPNAPGYVAEPRPTPVDLYVFTDPDGAYSSALLMVPASDGQGGVAVPIPPSFVLPETPDALPLPMNEVWPEGGLEALQQRLGGALGVRIGSAEVVDAAAFSQLVGTEPLVVDNPDNVIERSVEGEETVRYEAGELSLGSDDLLRYMGFAGADDPAPNQAIRNRDAFDAIFERAGTIELEELPVGEQTEGSESPGFGTTLAAHLAGEHRFDSLPLEKIQIPGTIYTVWMIDPDTLGAFVARNIPLPQSPTPGARVSVSLLNGTADPAALGTVLPAIVAPGGEVVLVGNAESFDVPTTRVEYASDDVAPYAQAVAAALGVTATKVTTPIPDSAVRVVVGADALG